jgi:hypothetical protein
MQGGQWLHAKCTRPLQAGNLRRAASQQRCTPTLLHNRGWLAWKAGLDSHAVHVVDVKRSGLFVMSGGVTEASATRAPERRGQQQGLTKVPHAVLANFA